MNTTTNNDQVKNLIQIRKSLARNKKGDLANSQAFLDFLKIQAELTKEIDDTWKTVEQLMLDYGVNKITGDWGHILIAERKTFRDNGAAPRFMRKVLDSSKVSAYYTLHKKLPEGISLLTTKYLSKKIKVA